jgi:acyl-CoA synthetase (NDP forming)
MAGSALDRRLARLLAPSSIAIVGASDKPGYGSRMLRNLEESGFQGAIYPVNPRHDRIGGRVAFPSIAALPEPAELAMVLTPADQVPGILAECGSAGTGAAYVLSAGFAERGLAGAALQQELVEAARKHGVRVCGPNGLGIVNAATSMFATGSIWPWEFARLRSGPISILSQSGAVAMTSLLSRAATRAIGIRSVVSVGNQAELTAIDLLEHIVDHDEGTRVVAMLLEGLAEGDGRRLATVAVRAWEHDKRIVLLKVGRSELGARATMSHTAALAGDDGVLDDVLALAGVARVDELDDLLSTAQLLTLPRPRGGIAFLSNSGGFNSLFADAAGVAQLPMPDLAERTVQVMATALGDRGSAGNPADLSGAMARPGMGPIAHAAASDPGIGMLVLGLTRLTWGEAADVAAVEIGAIAAREHTPVAMIWGSEPDLDEHARSAAVTIAESGIPTFHSIRGAVQALRHLYAAGVPFAAAPSMPGRSVEEDLVDPFELLRAAEITVPRGGIATNAEEALGLADELGYPVVAKLASAGVDHRSEMGGVVVGISSAAELSSVVLRFADWAAGRGEACAVYVHEMVQAELELIIGCLRESAFGPVIAVGAGGVLANLLGDVTFALAPVDERGARRMLEKLVAFRLLEGFRGRPALDTDAVVSTIVALSRSFADGLLSAYDEVEINPLMVTRSGGGAVAVDAKVRTVSTRG